MRNLIIKSESAIKKNIVVDVTDQKIRVQEARLFAALIESGWTLKVNLDQAVALGTIHAYFPIYVSEYAGENTIKIPIVIDHEKPLIRFGHVERPLIFPEWIADVEKAGNDEKDYVVSFQGFPQVNRVYMALRFVERSFNVPSKKLRRVVLAVNNLPHCWIRTKLLNFLFSKMKLGVKCFFEWSSGGRKLTNKVVDGPYWSILHRSTMAYCPSGDFGWTYRFYEAMLANALPVLDGEGDLSYSDKFTTLLNIKDMPAGENLQDILKRNRILTLAMVTAKSELDTRFFENKYI